LISSKERTTTRRGPNWIPYCIARESTENVCAVRQKSTSKRIGTGRRLGGKMGRRALVSRQKIGVSVLTDPVRKWEEKKSPETRQEVIGKGKGEERREKKGGKAIKTKGYRKKEHTS